MGGMRGLVLSGGGARGLAHIGVLEVLLGAGYTFDLVAGTSIGAIIGALLAAGQDPKAILELAKGTPWLGLLGFSPREGFLSRKKLGRFLAEHLPSRFEDLRLTLVVTAVEVSSGRLLYLSRGDLVSAVMASAAYPGLVAPVEREGLLLFDGGVLDNLPVNAARSLGAKEVWAVDVTPGREAVDPPQGPLALGLRAVEIMQHQLNALRLAFYPPEVYIRPNLEGIRIQDFLRLEEIVRRGREAARAFLGKVEGV